MSLPTPIDIDAQLAVLKDAYTSWVTPRKGQCLVMENQSHLWENLSVITDYPRCLLMFVKETPIEPKDAGRVERRFVVVLVRSRGFTDPASGGAVKEPMAKTLESARDLGRSIQNISDSEVWPPVQYDGSEPLPNILPSKEANAFADAVLINLTTYNDLPAVLPSQP